MRQNDEISVWLSYNIYNNPTKTKSINYTHHSLLEFLNRTSRSGTSSPQDCEPLSRGVFFLATYQSSADILRCVVISSDVTSLCCFWPQLSRSCPNGSSPFMSEWVWWSPRTTAEQLWFSHKTTVVCVTCHHLTTRHYLRRSGISAVPLPPHTHFDFFWTQASGWSEDVVSGVCLHFSHICYWTVRLLRSPVPWLRRVVTGLPPWGHGFDLCPRLVEFVTDKLALA